MTVRKILCYPDPKLRIPTQPVKIIDHVIQTLIDDMLETMYENRGCGLAATQIGESQKIFVVDLSRNKTEPYIFINPKILEKSGEQAEEEGCLSVPGIFKKVTRAAHVKVQALNRQGKNFETEADHSYLAQCLQHEIDHLYGKLFIDGLSLLKKNRIKTKLKKRQQETY